jgi:Zn-dependent protease with chaperone function
MRRNFRGIATALICAWFYVPFAVFAAAVFGVLGAIVGFAGGALSGTQIPVLGESIPAGLQIGGMFGLAAGLIAGGVVGFLLGMFGPFLLVQEDVAAALGVVVGQVAVGLFVGVVYTIFSVSTEATRLKIAGARRPSRREEELLMPIMHECAHRLDLPGLPRLLIDDTKAVNAYAATRHIVLNQGLLDEFNYDREVIAGVLCHELGHWNNADPVASTFVRGVALPLYIVYTIAARLLEWLRHPILQLFLWAILFPVLITVRFIIAPMQGIESRAAEYRADRVAVLGGHREGVRRFLARIRRTIDRGMTGWDETICQTHPPTELRLEALEEPGKSYPLPDEDAPVRPLPVAVASGLQRD